MPTLHELSDLGQAAWLDYIRRSFVLGGELQQWIDRGVRGVTANPTILEKAIDGSSDYDEHLARLAKEGKSADEIYEALALEDIGSAADLLRPVYDRFGDGFVSLEVSPSLAHDTHGTIAGAQHLFAALGRPNVFIKVPATKEGFPAIEELIRQGLNVNVTLIFSISQYEASAEAYLRGLERRAEKGESISGLASVASFFVSRVDTAVDRALEGIGNRDLQGKIAVANAKLAYARFKESSRDRAGRNWPERARRCSARCGRALARRTPATQTRCTWMS